jgi:hypothetical protein
MSKVLKYAVVDADSLDHLVDAVQQRINLGWQPLGGPFYLNGDHHQAVVWTQEAEERARTPHEVKYGQNEIELIDELTEDDQPISRWEAGLDDGRNGTVG